jgi:hypothetical protein
MITTRKQYTILVDHKTGEYWDRDGGWTSSLASAAFFYPGVIDFKHMLISYPTMVLGTLDMEVRYYEKRENEEA